MGPIERLDFGLTIVYDGVMMAPFSSPEYVVLNDMDLSFCAGNKAGLRIPIMETKTRVCKFMI